MSKPMVYELETNYGSWNEVRVTTNDRKGSHGAALYRWREKENGRYNLEWYGVSRGVGDWYQGASDIDMTDEFFDARWDAIEDCLDGLSYGMTANDIRAAVSACLTLEDEA
jgi:hypothetical protein